MGVKIVINVLLVEDDIIQANALNIILNNEFQQMNFHTASNYNHAAQLIDDDEYSFQLFLLDIELDKDNVEKNGIKLGEHIRSVSKYKTTPILYITGNPNEIFNAIHNTNCFDYLVKPYGASDLINSINKLLDTNIIEQPPLVFKDIYGTYSRISCDTITYIKGSKHHVYIYTLNNSYKTGSYRMTELVEILPNYIFQCHKSYIVNVKFIKSFDSNTSAINLLNSVNTIIPVGRSFKEKVKELLK